MKGPHGLGLCFRTGDIARATPTGWELVGRRDGQVRAASYLLFNILYLHAPLLVVSWPLLSQAELLTCILCPDR